MANVLYSPPNTSQIHMYYVCRQQSPAGINLCPFCEDPEIPSFNENPRRVPSFLQTAVNIHFYRQNYQIYSRNYMFLLRNPAMICMTVIVAEPQVYQEESRGSVRVKAQRCVNKP